MTLASSPANCIFITSFGRVQLKVTRVVHGMSIISYSPEGQSRRGKAFYPAKQTSGSFEVTAIFSTYGGYERVAQWLERYSRWTSNPKRDVSPIRVLIPARNFDKVGILKGGITYGDAVGEITRTMVLSFVGSRDPLALMNRNFSVFRLPKHSNDPSTPYLYPAGTQLRANAVGDDGWELIWNNETGQELGEADTPQGTPPPDPPGGATW